MTKSKLYLAGDGDEWTMEEMVDRVIYWWFRYKGRRTEDGKDLSKSDVYELKRRLEKLANFPERFKFNNPNMELNEDDDALEVENE